MVDIHSHILPYVDDGSSSVDDSIEMLKMAEYSGTDAIVLTPHSNLYDDSKNLFEEMKTVFDAFKSKLESEDMHIDVYLGGEIFCNDDAIALAREKVLPTINSSRFLLVEFDFYASVGYMTDRLKQLSALGYVPIVAHPERYECVKARVGAGIDMMNCGALLQVNKGSLIGDFGIGARDTAFELINHRFAQFVASDAHSTHNRNTDMELAFDIVRENFGDKMANKLFDINPRCVIDDKKLVISRPIL